MINLSDRTAKLNDLMFMQALKGSPGTPRSWKKKCSASCPTCRRSASSRAAYWDSTADIYSLGAVTYARLTGGPPFQGQTPGETIDLIRGGRPVPPRKFFKDCPEQFQTVLLKMLSRSQEDRYSTPDLMLEQLEACQTLP